MRKNRYAMPEYRPSNLLDKLQEKALKLDEEEGERRTCISLRPEQGRRAAVGAGLRAYQQFFSHALEPSGL